MSEQPPADPPLIDLNAPDPSDARRPVLDGRARDVLYWWLTPVLTLLLGPAVACAAGVPMLISGDDPAFCAQRTSNGCQEAAVALGSRQVVLFGVLWLLLWTIPWRRSMRPWRFVVAGLATLMLVAVPLTIAYPVLPF